MQQQLRVYKCGLRPGDRVRLRKDLVVRGHRNRSTGEVHPKARSGRCFLIPAACGTTFGAWDDETSQAEEWFERVSR